MRQYMEKLEPNQLPGIKPDSSQAEQSHIQPTDPWEKINVLLKAPESLKLIDMQQKRFQTND